MDHDAVAAAWSAEIATLPLEQQQIIIQAMEKRLQALPSAPRLGVDDA